MPQVEINGEKMYIPQSGMAQFTKDYPEANIHYVVGKETLSIPFKNTESFLKDYPNAIGLGDEQVQPQTATPKAAVAVQTPNERSYQQYEQKQNEIYKTGAPVNFFKTNDKPITFTEGKGFDVPEGYMKRILPGNEVEQANARMKTTIARGVDKTYQNKKSRELETQYAPVIERHIKEKAQETTKEVDLMEQKYNNLKQNNKTSILDSGNIDWLLTNTKEALNKPSRHEETNIAEDVWNYAKGFGNKITNRDTWTLGMTEIGRSLNTANIFKKLQSGQKLQEDEELLLSAFVTNMAANDLRAEDVSLAYQAGEGTAQSIPFMAEFAIIGGASNAVKSGLIKSVTKTMGARSASIVTKWLESNLLKHTLGTAAMTAAMPTTYASMASDYLDKTLAGEEYDLADAGRSFGNSFVENFTERTVGKLLDKGMGAVTNKMIGDKLSGFTKLGKAWNETGILKDIPINSPLGELGEEYVGAGINYGRSFNPLYDDAENEKMRDEASQLFTADGTKVMLGSILPMTMLPGVFGLYKNQKNKADRETLITNLLQPDISDKVNVHDTNTLVGTQLAFQKSKEAMDNALADLDFTFNPDVADLDPQDQRAILHDVLTAENLSREQKNAIVEYVSNAALQKTIQENRQSQLDNEIQSQREFLQGAVNVETGTLVRGRLKGDESGQTIFITGGLRLKDNENQQAEIDLENSNEAIYYRNEAGEVVPTTADAIEFVGESGVEQEVQLFSEYYQNAYNQQNAEVNAAVQQALLQDQAQQTQQSPTGQQQTTYAPGTSVVVNGTTFVVGEQDEAGNYLINDENGQQLDRFTPDEMAEFGFRSVAVRPTQAEQVVSGDMTENAPVTAESAPVQYPLNKKGEIDFDAMTVAQTYEYMVDNYGQEEANNGLSMQEKSIQALISQNIKALSKVNEQLYGQLRTAKTYQEQLKIREKNKATITKLTDERTALDTQLAEIRALMPVVQQTPAQPEVMAVKGSNVRPEEQLRREQEAKLRQVQQTPATEKTEDNVDAVDNIAETVVSEQQPVVEVREKEEWKGTPQWTRRLINLGDAMTVEDVVLRRIAGGAKFVWTASAPLKGLAEELGFTNKPGERKLRKNLIDNENGMTPQEFAHVIYESGDLDFMPGVEYQDVYNAVVETLLQVNSATMAMEKAEANRNKYDMMQEDYDIYRSIIPEEWAYLEEIPDEILAGYLGITNFSPEQIDFIFNIQNEYYANEQQQTTVNAEPADTSTSERSEAPESNETAGQQTELTQAELDTQELDAEYKETPEAVEKVDSNVDTPEAIKTKLLSELTLPKYVYDFFNSLNQSESSDYIFAVYGKGFAPFNGRKINEFFSYVRNAINNNDKIAKEILQDKGFDISNVEKVDYTRIWFKNGIFLSKTTGETNSNANYFYAGTQVNIRDTKEYREISDQSVDVNEMIEKPAEATSAPKYKNGDTVYYQGKQYVINGIYNGVLAYDLETADGKPAFDEVDESKLSNQAPAPRSILDVAVEQVKKNEEKAKVKNEIPVSEDGLYQIREVKVKKNDGSIVTMFAVPTANSKGFGDKFNDLFDTIEEAIVGAKENRAEQQRDEERDIQYAEEKRLAEEAKAAKAKANEGKTSKQLMDEARENSVLDKKLNYDGVIMTRRQFIEKSIANGATLQTEQVNVIKDVSRTTWNRMNGREQDDFERRQKEAGKKTEYQIKSEEGYYYTITKIEYDYAQRLLKQSDNSKPTEESKPKADKVSAAQAEADAALQDFLDAFNDLNSDNLGIVDNTAEKQAKMLVAGTKMVGAYTRLGVYKFADLVKKIQVAGVTLTEDLLSAIKKAYGAFAAESDIDELDDMKTVRSFTLNDLQQKKNEDLTPKTDNLPKNDVSLTDQNTTKNNGSNKPNSRTADSKPKPNRTGLSLFDEVDGQGTSTENIAGNSKGEQLQPGNSSSESGNRPQYDVNKTYTNDEISEIVSSVTILKNGKIEITGEVTDDIKTIASRYVSGGVAKQGRGILDEYYTDSKIVDAVTRIITKLIPSATVKRALEPSVGTGNFIQAIPTSAEIVGFEINETTSRIAKIFHPTVEVNLRSFETEFIDDSGKKKPITRKYNLVVGNPPYGEHRGMYKGLGEESKITKYEDYFVKRSLDVLEEGGVLAMVLPSSWMDRHKTESGYTIEAAYRLPSGAFEATQVGTDIVVLRKNAAHTSSEPHNYFQNNPDNVLGEIKERSNRFGRMEQYVAGDIDAALAMIEQNEARKVANDLQIEATADNVNDIAESIEETGSPEKAKKVVKASKQTKTATVTTGKVEIKKGTLKYNLNKGDEVVPASSQFPNEFTPEQEAAFKDCDYSGIIPKSKYEQHKQFVNFYNFDWVHDFYYAEGNIYEKLEQLERDKPNMDQAQYDKQKQMLRSVLPEIKTLDKVSISPNTEFVKNLSISTDKSNSGVMSLKDLFEDFCRKLPRESFGNSSSWEVIDYVENRQVYGQDKERNALVRERRKAAANDLFKKFLTDEVSAAERSQIEYAFNREYNAMYRPDYSKVPMFSSINKNFKGRPLQLTIVQRAGIGRSTVKGVGILAHEVGFGKTLSGILAVHEAMTRGTAKKPLIVVPNDSILKQWVETIHEVLPQSTVNVLGNLGVDYDLTDFAVNDSEITLVTYEGFKAMGFKDETYDKLAQNFNYITDDLKAHKSERDRQKEKAKQDETKGKMRKKVAYDFEDFGFDFMTFDEVHNANHIVGKVKLDKSVASDFRSQSQRTSDLGIKTWLASQYIQENNDGRNVLLLSATPFTNKPLEYYSILSLVGNSTLKRMGFYQVDQFFETFMEADNDIEIKADGTPAQKTNVRRFKNNGLFNQLLSEFIDIKGEDDNPDLVRPERHNREYKIPQNDLTAETISNIQDLFRNNEDVLKGITHSRLVAFSPYASSYSYATPKNYKQFVENSPKIHTALKLIAQNKKDNSGAGQLMYSEIGVEFFPMIQEYLIKEIGYNVNEVKIISGATSLTERANIQNGFNKGEIKVIIGSPAIKEGINLQENTTDMYILSLPYNFTQLRQVEGRSWRQGNKWSNIRVNYMLTDNSIDVFLLQRLQIKQGLYNESMKNGADTVDVSDIDTSELKTALITDPTTRANIELMIERGRLEAEKTRITSDLAFIHRKFEKYNELKKKINTEITSLQQREKWAETDTWWARNLDGARKQVETLKNEIENEKQKLAEKGVNVDDIVSQETNATNQIAEINKKIEALKERLNELIVKYTAENIAKAKIEGDVVSRYIKERAQENKGDFYTKRIADPQFQAISPIGFYSTVEKALEAINQERGTRDQFRAMLLKNGAKQAEMDWMGFDELPEKLTKADVQSWIDENRIEVEEVEKIDREKATDKDANKYSKYHRFVLPGGENYKELLLTMPVKETFDTYRVKLQEKYGELSTRNDYSKEENEKLDYLFKNNSDKFRSSHFDEPNILAHIRFNERTVNGERVLFIEEFQSDWAQKGKKEGFNTKELEKRRAENKKELTKISNELDNLKNEYRQRYWNISTIEENKYNELNDIHSNLLVENSALNSSIPNMPFRKTDQWVNLAARRMMRYAAENGFDRIAWTNGEQQADRYDLSKSIKEIEYSINPFVVSQKDNLPMYNLKARDKNDNPVIKGEYAENELENIVGKELAKKIINGEGKETVDKTKSLTGLDLKVGGEGMKAFYDAIVPSAMSKLGKPFGAKVESLELSQPRGERSDYEDLGAWEDAYEGTTSTQQSIPVTDSMKETAMAGLPLYHTGTTMQRSTPEEVAETVAQLLKTGLAKEVRMVTPEEIETVDSKAAQMLKTKSGTIYGFVKGGVVYLNSTTPNLNTPIHEFGHLWVDAIEGSDLYNRGAELVKGTPYWERVNTDPNYKDLSETARIKEAMAMAIGDKGEAVKRDLGLFASIKVWIADVWTRIGAKFGIQNLTPEQIQNLTFTDFVEVAVSELMSGKPLTAPQPPKGGAIPATIEVDGVQRPTMNSNGKPIHSTEEGIRNFWKWFGDSKVVDEQGRPLVVYHGTTKNFNSFKDEFKGTNTAHDKNNVGYHFTSDPKYADTYNRIWQSEGHIIFKEMFGYEPAATPFHESSTIPAYLKISNPNIIEPKAINKELIAESTNNNNDGIISTWGGQTEYVAFKPTQIKSATGNDGSFDPNEPDIRFQIIGERGAEALDAAEEATTRLDNLRVAKEMEVKTVDNGDNADRVYTPQEIRLATGWERGVDGKYRYEIPDLDLKINPLSLGIERQKEMSSIVGKGHGSISTMRENSDPMVDKYNSIENEIKRLDEGVSLSEYISDDLIKSYPELANIKVKTNAFISDGTLGSFDTNKTTGEKTINIAGSYAVKTQEQFKSVLIHEIQHAIQEIEGFAKGGNINTDTDTNAFENYNFNSREAKAIIKAKEDFNNSELGKQIQETQQKDTEKWIKLMSERNLSNEEWKAIANAERNFKTQNGISPKEYIDKYPTFNNYASEQYTRLSGEVEARNASARMNMSEEERRQTLLSATADVAPEDQIVLMDAMGASMSEPEKPEFTGDLGKFAQQTTEYNEAQAERTTRISKMQRLQEIMVAKSALAARHRNKEVSNQEYAKQMTALHEEKQRVMKGLPTSTSSVTDASTSSTTEIDDPKPVRAIGQSIAEYATQIADWNYRQTIARALAKTASSVTGGLPPVDDDTDINGDMLRAELDQRLGGFFGRLVEGWQDNIRSVRIFQDMLKEKGTRISDFNNFHMQYTAIQGKNDAHLKDFGKRFMEAINANVLNIQKYTNYEYRDLENYVFLKHGIERNEYMRQAAAMEAVNEKLPKLTQEQIDGDIDGSLQDEYKAAYDQFLEEETAKVADKDYSGLFAVAAEIWAKQNGEAFNPKKKGDVARIQKMDEFKAERDAVIVEYIAKFEKTISETIIPTAVKGEQLTINGFWAAINAATHYSIDRLVTSGIEDKTEMDELKSRFKYYVPLRGHEVEAEKIWQYEAPDNKNVVSKAIIKAWGRTSRAEHPFAYIIQQAQTQINKANRNQLNQTILRLARLDKSGLMSVSETWYVLTGTDPDSGKEIWTETEPDFSEDHEIRAGEIRAWNEKMKKLEEEGKARRFKKGLRIGGLFIKPKQKRQHAITIFEDGVAYQVYINGNPRVSQAINELNGTKWNIPIITQTTRFISSMITSRSPQFMLTNGARDLAFASSILPSKEGARYTGQFLKNYPVAMAILANNATFDFGNDKARYKKYLKEFEINGGETGYSHLLELQDIQKELYKKQKGKNYLNPLTDLDAIISVVDAGNKVIENSTRLAVYISSRESGRSIERSVSDSKEVTLNFNRRGSGIMGAAHVSSIFMFVNAGVQALANFGHVYKMHPAKMSATIGAYAAVGFIMPMIINMIGGDDDEKEYMNMTDWERQTNLCLPTGSGFAKIPLPQEMRVFFKLGDEVYKLYSGRTEASETAMATLLSAADMIPISPLGTIAAGEIGDFGDLQRAISPDALRGVAELATNTNFMGGQIYDKYKADKDELPGYQKARLNRVGDPRAPESIVGFTKWLDHLTGGNGVEKGAVSWNPDIVNHLAKSYLGGMYSLVAEGGRSFTKRFYTSNADIEEKNTTVKDYYKRIREAEEILRQDKGYWEQVEKGEISEDTYNKAIPPTALEKAYTIHDYGNTITKIERLLKTGDLTPDDELYYKHMSDSLKMEVIRIR